MLLVTGDALGGQKVQTLESPEQSRRSSDEEECISEMLPSWEHLGWPSNLKLSLECDSGDEIFQSHPVTHGDIGHRFPDR